MLNNISVVVNENNNGMQRLIGSFGFKKIMDGVYRMKRNSQITKSINY